MVVNRAAFLTLSVNGAGYLIMEKIKQALEMARTQREKERVSASAHHQKSARVSMDVEKITYTHTHSFQPDYRLLRRNRVLLGTESDAPTRAMKMLRTQVLQRMVANGWNALAITSPGPGQGKTLTAINLAISLAREVNYSVLLVDLDLHNPTVHKYFGYSPNVGLDDYLREDVGLSEILFNPDIEHLVVLPNKAPVTGSSELLSSPQMHALVEEMKTRYPTRFVLFDLPPLLSVDDALSFAPYVDSVLLVVEEGTTTKDDIAYSLDLLQATPILGTVLNKSNARVSEAY